MIDDTIKNAISFNEMENYDDDLIEDDTADEEEIAPDQDDTDNAGRDNDDDGSGDW